MIKKLINILFFVGSILLLIWPALANGFPLVYSDSGSYIASGFTNEVPIDRPIFYGLIVRHISLSFSLWLVIIFQAIMVYFFVHSFLMELKIKKNSLYSFIFIATLSLFTGLSNYTSQIMADIFGGLIILGLLTLFITEKIKIKHYFLILFITYFTLTHSSYLLLIAGLSAILILVKYFKKNKANVFVLAYFIVVPFLVTALTNKIYYGKFELSRASNVFVISRMLESGVLKPYLEENCDKKNYLICDKIDKLPQKGFEFLWTDSSPLYDSICVQETWTNCWKEKDSAYKSIIKDILVNSKYRNIYIKNNLKDLVKQCYNFDIGVLTPQKENSPSYNEIKWHFKEEFPSYIKTNQYQETLEFKTISSIQFYLVLLSFILLFYIAYLLKKQYLYLLLLLAILINNTIVVFLSTNLDRYASRLIWLIPFMLFAFVVYYFQQKKHLPKT